MIPIQLTLQGIYSYQERQTIDFTKLTEAGLFGIFGAVGSGKSSILEAISFALYGETERLNSRDKRAYNMMNLKANSSFMQFDFINHENKIFRVAREFKRNSKKFEDVKPGSVVLYEKQNEKWIPLDHSDCEKIIGLSYANFKRTIIIPQGQFKEFLELGAAERTNMMKEIFNLQQYDLQNNASILNSKNTAELNQLEGQLKGFEEINEENISGQKILLANAQQAFEEATDKFKKAETQYHYLKNLKGDFELLNSKKEHYQKLLGEKENFDQLEAKTELYDRIFRAFSPLLSEKIKLQSELNIKKAEHDSHSVILKETTFKALQNKNELEKIQPDYEALDQSKIQENDLSIMMQMLGYASEIHMLKERTENGAAKVKDVESQQHLMKEKIQKIEGQLNELKPKKLDTHLLLDVGNWFATKKNILETLQVQKQKTENFNIELQKIEEELKPFGIEIDNFANQFNSKISDLEIQKKEISERKSHLEVQQKLAHFADELHDGKSCPLCGSLEHPNVVEFDDVSAELDKIQKQTDAIVFEQKEIQAKISEVEKILVRKKLLQTQLEKENEQLRTINVQLENHLKTFSWIEFNPENEGDFNRKRIESFEFEKQIESLQTEVSKEQKNLEQTQSDLNKFNKALEEFKLKEHEVHTKILSSETNLKALKWVDYRNHPIPEVEKLYAGLSKHNSETEKKHQQLVQEEKEIAVNLATQKSTVLHLEKQIFDLKQEINANEKHVNEELGLHNFTNLKEIEPVLAQEINIQGNRNLIQNFRIEFETLKNGIKELEKKLKGFHFDQTQFLEVESQFKILETEKINANDAVVKLKSEIERLLTEFRKKEGLLKDLSNLQRRAENLKIMTNLFKGAGFVQYVSSIYLRQLCDNANIRFHRMTRNQLSLQLNDNNDFEIIDYLNQARCRSVKTLSGGQAFQVSLSLALALAESVQTNAKSDKNFFFIDEGFGTQDLESVNVVFETLTSLQKENRIVGIISHVEELKEKIPVSLNIRKDEERGSLIEMV